MANNYLLRYVGADRLPRKLPPKELGTFFDLSRKDIEALQARRSADRYPNATDRVVGLAAQVVFMRATGRPLAQVSAIPTSLLTAIGRALKIPVPKIATLRALYKREKTLYNQQVWARDHLGIQAAHAEDHARFKAMLAAHASEVSSTDELVRAAQHWYFNEKLLVPAEGSLREQSATAFAHVERDALRAMKHAIPEKELQAVTSAVFAEREDGSRTILSWLKQPPQRHSKKTRDTTAEKIKYLMKLGAHAWDLGKISLRRQHAYSQSLSSKAPSDVKRRNTGVLQLQVVCFLRMTLLELSESFLQQGTRRISDLVGRAYERTARTPAQTASAYRDRVLAMQAVLEDGNLDLQARVDTLAEAIRNTLVDLAPMPRAALMRRALLEDGRRVHELLKSLATMDFQGYPSDVAFQQLETWKDLQSQGLSEIPKGLDVPATKVWRELIDSQDREHAFRALEAATLVGLRRGLRRGSVWLPHTFSYRERDEMPIPPEEWEKQRDRHVALMGLGKSADGFITTQLKVLQRGIKALDKAIRDGAVTVDEHGVIHLPKITAEEHDYDPKQVRSLVYAAIGDVQLPDLLLEMDAATNFSEILLGRKAYDEQELLATYAALLAHGTEMDAKSVAAMIPQLEPAQVATVMRLLETPGRLEKANQRVVEFMNSHPITRRWGDGTQASSDMMSLDATRHLLTARMDPKRRTPSIGIYSHVTNTYALAYSQQWVLNERQAGPAVHGVVRFNAMNDTALLKLAVDTHGYTYPATSLAKLLGFDLCVRLQNLKERKLYVPTDTKVPASLEKVLHAEISLLSVRKQWDELLRIAASIHSGRISATVAMARLGGAAAGEPIHRAADQLGRLLRTIFLLDYFTLPAFRREMHRVLNRGESVHLLQRAIYYGRLPASRGRRLDEMIAISGSHGLLTNLVMAWNTMKLQAVVDRLGRNKGTLDEDSLASIGPCAFSHINFKGTLRFSLDQYRDVLIVDRKTRRAA